MLAFMPEAKKAAAGRRSLPNTASLLRSGAGKLARTFRSLLSPMRHQAASFPTPDDGAPL